MKARAIAFLLVTVVLLALLQSTADELSYTVPVKVHEVYDLPPMADAGRDFITYVGLPTQFRGHGAAAHDEITKYEWDFDGDRIFDFESSRTGITSYIYDAAGTYSAVLRVHDAQGQTATDAVEVIVKEGPGRQEYLPEVRVEPERGPSALAEGDGVVERYAVMVNGGHETRFWDDVTFMYSTLTDDYNIPPERIHLLNYDGTNPDGVNPNNMIDYAATLSNIDTVFADLSASIDGDDELFVWVTDHGRGYTGPKRRSYGYLDGFASVDPGDEPDYLESDFKLRSLCTYGDYASPYYNHGMDEFKVYGAYSSSQGAYRMYRNKFVSTFTDLYFESSGVQSDADIYIERLVDYLLGDTDRDGLVETAQGEVFDYDRDGNPPYVYGTGTFDEDDWGDLDYYDDDFNYINSGYPGDSYIIFDYNFDNHVDIDLNYDPGNLEVDGTDLDNQGLFDGIDVNDDGDMDDWVSIDEKICLYGTDMLDDEMAAFLNRIDARVISIFMQQCFSGGFIDDLSASNRVISTATEEETVAWGNSFVELSTSAFHRAARRGEPVDADYNHNGHIAMMEAFNYAAEHDHNDEVPQYDDNGDGLGHPYPIPQGGDGSLGAVTYLESWHGLTLMPLADMKFGDPGTAVTYTLQVTNMGNITDTFDASVSSNTWPTTAPPSVQLSAGDSTDVDVIVNIPPGVTGGTADTATVTITSQGDNTQSATAVLTTTARIAYGVTVKPATEAQFGDPGTAVTYTLQVTNMGNITDTFDASVSSNTWPTTAPRSVQLSAGDSTDVDVIVNIPSSASGGEADIVNITFISQGDCTKRATAVLTTTAKYRHSFLPLIVKLSAGQ